MYHNIIRHNMIMHEFNYAYYIMDLRYPYLALACISRGWGPFLWSSSYFHNNSGLEKLKLMNIPVQIDIFVWIKPRMSWIFQKWSTRSHLRVPSAICGILLTYCSDFGSKKCFYPFKIKIYLSIIHFIPFF